MTTPMSPAVRLAAFIDRGIRNGAFTPGEAGAATVEANNRLAYRDGLYALLAECDRCGEVEPNVMDAYACNRHRGHEGDHGVMAGADDGFIARWSGVAVQYGSVTV